MTAIGQKQSIAAYNIKGDSQRLHIAYGTRAMPAVKGRSRVSKDEGRIFLLGRGESSLLEWMSACLLT